MFSKYFDKETHLPARRIALPIEPIHTFLPCFTHLEKLRMELNFLQQLNIKNITKCWKDFFLLFLNSINIPWSLVVSGDENQDNNVKRYMDIDVGLKMNSYTVNGLQPGIEYLFELCLRKEEYIIPISSTLLTTRNSGYEVALGIETDYVTLVTVTLILTTLVISCFALSFLR